MRANHVDRMLRCVVATPGQTAKQLADDLGIAFYQTANGVLRQLEDRRLVRRVRVRAPEGARPYWTVHWYPVDAAVSAASDTTYTDALCEDVLREIREHGGRTVKQLHTVTGADVATLRTLCRALVHSDRITRERQSGAVMFRPFVEDGEPLGDDDWTPQPYVHPIRARFLEALR